MADNNTQTPKEKKPTLNGVRKEECRSHGETMRINEEAEIAAYTLINDQRASQESSEVKIATSKPMLKRGPNMRILTTVEAIDTNNPTCLKEFNAGFFRVASVVRSPSSSPKTAKATADSPVAGRSSALTSDEEAKQVSHREQETLQILRLKHPQPCLVSIICDRSTFYSRMKIKRQALAMMAATRYGKMLSYRPPT